MEVLAFARQEDNRQPELGEVSTSRQLDGTEVRAAILDLAAGSGGTQDVLQGYIAGATLAEETAATVHAALREAGHQVSREAVEEALREIASELGSSEPEPEPAPEAPAEAPSSGTEVMPIVDLLEELADLDVQLRCGRREDRLHVTPRSALSAEHVAAIQTWRREIIELLRDYELQETGVLQDERQVFEEFRRVKAAREAG